MNTRFQKWALATTLATYLLILIGGTVRASDAGLGCPDWPVCFGKPYPPFTYAELLDRDIPADFDITDFHVSLAWIEYTNRLAGTIIGLLIIGTVVSAWRNHRHNRHIMLPAFGALIAVLINGWMGSQVIGSRLNPIVITIHLGLAWVQVIFLLYATVHAFYPEARESLSSQRRTLARASLVVLLLTLIQAGMGTNLRGQLEDIEKDNPQMERGDLIHEANLIDQVHRSYSWVVLIGTLALGWYAHTRLQDDHIWLRYVTQGTTVLVLLQVAAGIGLAYVNLPPPLQVIHLVTASLLIGALALVYLFVVRLPVPAVTEPPAHSEAAPVPAA